MVTSSILRLQIAPQASLILKTWSSKAGSRSGRLSAAHSQRLSTFVSKGIKWATGRVGALKHPLLGYRAKVFAEAGATTPPDEYRVELGWVAVAKSRQGRGLSRRIIGQLISLVENENVFATTRADARAMRFRLITGLNPPVNPIRAAAATILFCIFVTRGGHLAGSVNHSDNISNKRN